MIDEGSELLVENKNKKKEVVDTKNIPIPPVGTIFMLDGNEYRVCYINEGKRRFSVEPFKGKYS